MHNKTRPFSSPFETFIKSTPSRPILVPLPWANIYHRLKVHLHVDQSFGDLCRLLEMDIVYRKDIVFAMWMDINTQGKQGPLVKGFTVLPSTLLGNRATTCSTTGNESILMKRTICCAVNQQIVHCLEVLGSGRHWGILLDKIDMSLLRRFCMS